MSGLEDYSPPALAKQGAHVLDALDCVCSR
jgi:hypothetical protein